jgi:hypothetical protein
MDPRLLVQRLVERGTVVVKLLPQLLLGLGLDEVGGGMPAHSLSYSGCAREPPEDGRAARDDEASVPSAGHPSTAPPSPLTTSAPVGGSGAGAGMLTH